MGSVKNDVVTDKPAVSASIYIWIPRNAMQTNYRGVSVATTQAQSCRNHSSFFSSQLFPDPEKKKAIQTHPNKFFNRRAIVDADFPDDGEDATAERSVPTRPFHPSATFVVVCDPLGFGANRL